MRNVVDIQVRADETIGPVSLIIVDRSLRHCSHGSIGVAGRMDSRVASCGRYQSNIRILCYRMTPDQMRLNSV